MNLKEAKEIAGTVSISNSKMPGPSYAISAKHCNVGGKLVNKEGSVCNKCYALRLQNFRPNVDKAWETNYYKTVYGLNTELTANEYVTAMVTQIEWGVKRTGQPFMRWFDSGDLINLHHLYVIDDIARKTPYVTHYLPTKEAAIVRKYLSEWATSPNLIIRVSSPMIDQPPLSRFPNTTTVHTVGNEHEGFACPARSQGNKCGDCRACWDPSVINVSYPKH
jgi:hypothetical protein